MIGNFMIVNWIYRKIELSIMKYTQNPYWDNTYRILQIITLIEEYTETPSFIIK